MTDHLETRKALQRARAEHEQESLVERAETLAKASDDTQATISREHSVAVSTREYPKLLTPEALEAIYMDGCADQVSGDVEAPTGHFYRVGRQIVETDSQGFKNFNSYTTEAEAEAEFDRLDNLYDEWMDDDEN
jgi:hypothetical protein